MPVEPTPFENTGYIGPLPDPRNFVAEAVQPEMVSTPIPASYVTDITPFKTPQTVFMQGQQPSCVAHAVTWAIQYYFWKKTGQVVKLSPRFLYALCKTNDGIPTQEGTYLLTALKLAQKYGVCEDKYFPNNVSLMKDVYKDATQIPQAAYDNALKYKIGTYAFLSDTSLQGLNRAIFQNGIVLIGMRIGQEWWTAVSGQTSWAPQDILPLRPPKVVVSGHAIALYAYGTFSYLMNWWSYAWGYQGHGWFGANDLPTVYEAAIITGLAIDPTQPAPPQPDTATQNGGFLKWVKQLLGLN